MHGGQGGNVGGGIVGQMSSSAVGQEAQVAGVPLYTGREEMCTTVDTKCNSYSNNSCN